jgi:hypothetical protein
LHPGEGTRDLSTSTKHHQAETGRASWWEGAPRNVTANGELRHA